jgi:hypothetical protein
MSIDNDLHCLMLCCLSFSVSHFRNVDDPLKLPYASIAIEDLYLNLRAHRGYYRSLEGQKNRLDEI